MFKACAIEQGWVEGAGVWIRRGRGRRLRRDCRSDQRLVELCEFAVRFFDEQFETGGFVVHDGAESACHFFGFDHDGGGNIHAGGCFVIDLGDAILRSGEAVGAPAVCFGVAEELAHQDENHEQDADGEEDRGEGIA